MKNILIWIIIFTFLIICYAFKFELEIFKNRILSVIIPSYSWTNQSGELAISRSNDGHFYLSAIAPNNSKIKFLVDTGASDIALTRQDALKLGFNPANLTYNKKYNTANGVSYAAPVRIKKLIIGEKIFYNLSAHVNSGNLDVSLLGMSVINNFTNFKISNDMLILNY